MEYLRLLKERYACRDFEPKRLPDEKVKELLEAIRLTPSALNLQPWRIKVVEDQEIKQRLFEYSMGAGTCAQLFSPVGFLCEHRHRGRHSRRREVYVGSKFP